MDSAADQSATPPLTAPPLVRRGTALGVALLRLGALAAALLVAYMVATRWNTWTGAASVQRTDDAYLAADLTPMGARVSGIVQAVPVDDFQRVRAGDLLVQIRDDDYRAQVSQAEADLASAEAQLAAVQAQRAQQQANIAAAGDAVHAMEAELARDAAEAKRQRDLLATGIAGTRQRVEQADAAGRAAVANLLRARAQLKAAVSQLGILDAQEKQGRAVIQARQAALDLARINLGYTRIAAPADGEVGQRLVRPGQYVGVGTQVIAVVSLPNVWVVANYKETQLTRVRVGQPATVTVDTFPGATLRGHVDSVAPGSGSQFSLLPPDNATGNFTKVVQRIPVKIVLDGGSGNAVGQGARALRDRLRPGMSVVASIHTGAGGTGTAAAAAGP
jgi:membrane fusion protein, multidrug efflux system